jgi:hypothetical protein
VLTDVHRYIAFFVVGLFSVGWIWGIVAWIRKKAPGERFWTWLAMAQVVAGIEVLIGLILLAIGKRPDTPLHYVYGGGPLVVLVIAHRVARDKQSSKGIAESEGKPMEPWVPFAVASFICFGLTLRALMTGLGAP